MEVPWVSSEDDESTNGGGPSSSEVSARRTGIPELELEPSEGTLFSSNVAMQSTGGRLDFLDLCGSITVMLGGRANGVIELCSIGSSAVVADTSTATFL